MRFLSVLALLAACNGSETPETLTGLPNAPGGNPLNPEVAMLPYPSDLYLQKADTETGFALDIPAEALPDGLTPELFASQDGWSLVPPILAFLPGSFDATQLPDLPGSLEADALVQLLDAQGSPVPILAELDGPAFSDDVRSLILRPQVALEPDQDYVVVLRRGLTAADGTEHQPSDAFRALADRIPTDSNEIERLREGFDLVEQALESRGLSLDDTLLAWRFHTRSRSPIIDANVHLHDTVMDADLGTVVIDSDVVEDDNRIIKAHFTGPDFLGPNDLFQFDDEGLPIAYGTRDVPFQLTIPATVDETRPLIVFGHGFFSSLEEPEWGSLQQSLQPWRMSAATTNFIGFTEDDLTAAAGALSGDLGKLRSILDMQLQSHANHTGMVRVIEEQLADQIVLPGGAPVIDTNSIQYMGISNGGTQGAVLLTTSPVLSRGALIVGGGGWSHMTQRAVQWNTLGGVFTTRYADPRQLQIVLGLMQQEFDRVDIMTYAPHLLEDRLPGRPPQVEISLHMAVGDAQVSNMITEWVAREVGVPLITPSARDVWGLETVSAPLEGMDLAIPAALTIYDEGYAPLPEGNVAPLDDNGAHETIRDLQSYQDNVEYFLLTGRHIQACDGACDPD